MVVRNLNVSVSLENIWENYDYIKISKNKETRKKLNNINFLISNSIFKKN